MLLANILFVVALLVVFILRNDIFRLLILVFQGKMVYYAWIMVKSVEQMVSSIEGSVRIMNDYPREEVDTEHFNKKLDTLIEWLKQTNENFKKLEELFHQVPDRTVFRETLKKRVDNLRPRLESLNEATLGIAQ